MDVGSGNRGAVPPWIFIHGTDIEDRGLIVLFSDFFSLASTGNFSADALAPTPCPTNVSTPLTVPLTDALHCYAFAPVFHYFVSERMEPSLLNCWFVNGKIKIFMVINSVPPTFSIVLRHWLLPV